MAINVTKDRMTSNITDVAAVRRPDGRWAVTDRPGRELTTNQATLAMLLAQLAALGRPHTPHTAAWEQQLHTAA